MTENQILETIFWAIGVAIQLVVAAAVGFAILWYVVFGAWLVGWLIALIVSRHNLVRIIAVSQVALAGFALAVPPAAYMLNLSSTVAEQDQRAQQIADFARVQLPDSAPTVLEVHGLLNAPETALVLHTLKIDEIWVFQRPRGDNLRGDRVLPPADAGCSEEAWKHVDGPPWSSRLRRCATWNRVQMQRADLPADSLVLLIGHETTLYNSNKVRGREGPYELRWRHAGQDELVDYWENTHHLEDPKTVIQFLQDNVQSRSRPAAGTP